MDETAWGSDWYFWEQNWTRGQVGPYRVQPLNQTHCCPLKRWAQTHSLFKLNSWLHLRKKKTLLRSFPTVQDVVQRTSLARLRHVELCFPQMYKSSCRQWEDLCPAPSAPVWSLLCRLQLQPKGMLSLLSVGQQSQPDSAWLFADSFFSLIWLHDLYVLLQDDYIFAALLNLPDFSGWKWIILSWSTFCGQNKLWQSFAWHLAQLQKNIAVNVWKLNRMENIVWLFKLW